MCHVVLKVCINASEKSIDTSQPAQFEQADLGQNRLILLRQVSAYQAGNIGLLPQELFGW